MPPSPPAPCPFCLPEDGRVAFVDSLIKGIWDAFPVTEGHLLITPHRHVASWLDLYPAEQAALTQAIARARDLIADRFPANAFNVGFNDGAAAGQTIPHFHLHVIPRRDGDMADPRGGVRHVIPGKGNYLAGSAPAQSPAPAPLAAPPAAATSHHPHHRALIAGGEDALIAHLLPHIDAAVRVDVAVSFTMESGVRRLRPHLQDLLARGGALRFLTGDYLDVTDPDALRRLLDLDGDAQFLVFEARATGFHPKSWIFHLKDGSGVALVGSSNLSEAALTTGVEWNYRVLTADQGGGWRDVLDGFEALIARPEIRPLTHDWIEAYERRRVTSDQNIRGVEAVEEPPPLPPAPHLIQQQALAALEATREAGFEAGMVVLATGLGKTWLAAFDADRPEFRRILFVAHREEILAQAMETFRLCRPKARLGRYAGAQRDLNADVLFASIQTLGRAAHLGQFAPDAFDYIVVDEFHHASARTYRALIEHFTPKFMLGLTATPDRMDGGDLLGLCQNNLVFECNAFDGIERRLLSPFSYFGVPDTVDYSNIPWRGGRFDEKDLELALATQARAQNAFEQHTRLAPPGARTVGFCCSQRHADFMAEFFAAKGLRCAAVHAGPSSAPRASSLQALREGALDALFAVDMFNEGLDVPEIDTVMMLRPTESTTIWMQQFGRGLRRSPGKERLTVVDYIGNHRAFLVKAGALFNCPLNDGVLRERFTEAAEHRLTLPPGCDVTYDLESLDILRGLLRAPRQAEAFAAHYADIKLRRGQRPAAADMAAAGFDPRHNASGDWFAFVQAQGDLSPNEIRALDRRRDFLTNLATTPLTRSYKMLLLKAMHAEDALPGAVAIDPLTRRFAALAAQNPRFRADVTAGLDDLKALKALLVRFPIDVWVQARGARAPSFFAYEDGVFSTRFDVVQADRAAFGDLVMETIDWRLADYLRRPAAQGGELEEGGVGGSDGGEGNPAHGDGGVSSARLWTEYMREEIPALFGHTFNTGAWNQGWVVQGKDAFILTTIDKRGLSAGTKYEGEFLSDTRFRWQSQNQTRQASKAGRIISGQESGYRVHLFVRPEKLRGSTAAPFLYCGEVDFLEWTGEQPITVTWGLGGAVPEHYRRVLGVGR